MATEIERKFLVDSQKWKPTGPGTKMVQVYLGLAPNPTVRIRIAGDQAFLTIKGRSETISRPEFEYEIPVADAKEMIKLTISKPVEKIRYKQFFKGYLWEIDVFFGANEGLVLAEIELNTEDEEFALPEWILTEVSCDGRFYNSYLSTHPYTDWDIDMA